MSEPAVELQWIHPPLQERSQQTMERLLCAAESLISEVGFAQATVADIARRAESSVGAFYSRFKDKDALLRCLLERFVADALATITHALRAEVWEKASVDAICSTLVRFIMQMLRERQGLIRAIGQMAIDEPTLSNYRNVIASHSAEGLQRLVYERGEEFGCANPQKALRVVTWTCLSMTEASAVGGEASSAAGLLREEFEAELCTMILSYLKIRPMQQGAMS